MYISRYRVELVYELDVLLSGLFDARQFSRAGAMQRILRCLLGPHMLLPILCVGLREVTWGRERVYFRLRYIGVSCDFGDGVCHHGSMGV